MPNIIEITDFNAPELDVYARLSENQLLHLHEPERGIFIAESPKVVERALNAGCVPISMLMEKKHITGEAAGLIMRCPGLPIYTAEFSILTQLTGFQLTRGVLCAMYRPKLPTIAEVCKDARRIAILENVMNPTNIGAIFRSAAALGIDAVLLTRSSCDPLNRRAVRVSMGSVFLVTWTWIDDIERDMHAAGFSTAAMALTDNSISIDNPLLKNLEKLAIIMGTEGDGLSSEVIAQTDYVVRIPMSHGVDSLNVAAAAAIAFWELRVRK